MEYNQIPKTGTIGGMVDNINANFQLTKEMLERLEVTKDHAVGLFSTLATLQAAYPSPEVGDWALVGDTTPFAIYKCSTAGTWSDTGGTYDGGTIDLSGYVKKEEFDELDAVVNGGSSETPATTTWTESGKMINYATGAEMSNSTAYAASNFIQIPSGTSSIRLWALVIKPGGSFVTTCGMAFYDSSQNYVSGIQREEYDHGGTAVPGMAERTYNVPNDARYLRVTCTVKQEGNWYCYFQSSIGSGLVGRMNNAELNIDAAAELAQEAYDLAEEGGKIQPSHDVYRHDTDPDAPLNYNSAKRGRAVYTTVFSEDVTFNRFIVKAVKASAADTSVAWRLNVFANTNTAYDYIPTRGDGLKGTTLKSGAVTVGDTAADVVVDLGEDITCPAGQQVIIYMMAAGEATIMLGRATTLQSDTHGTLYSNGEWSGTWYNAYPDANIGYSTCAPVLRYESAIMSREEVEDLVDDKLAEAGIDNTPTHVVYQHASDPESPALKGPARMGVGVYTGSFQDEEKFNAAIIKNISASADETQIEWRIYVNPTTGRAHDDIPPNGYAAVGTMVANGTAVVGMKPQNLTLRFDAATCPAGAQIIVYMLNTTTSATLTAGAPTDIVSDTHGSMGTTGTDWTAKWSCGSPDNGYRLCAPIIMWLSANISREEVIEIVDEEIASSSIGVDKYKINLADNIYCFVGSEVNIYNHHVSHAFSGGNRKPLNYLIEWKAVTGSADVKLIEAGVRIRPTAAGKTQIKCTMLDFHDNVLDEKILNVFAVAKDALTTKKNFLFVGSSWTQSWNDCVYKILSGTDTYNDAANVAHQRFTGTCPNFLGTQVLGGVHCEGHGGWTWKAFAYEDDPVISPDGSSDTEGTNPFWNPSTGKIDIAYYRNKLGMGNEHFDLVAWTLGGNDIARTQRAEPATVEEYTERIKTSIIPYLDTIVRAIEADNPDAIQIIPVRGNYQNKWVGYQNYLGYNSAHWEEVKSTYAYNLLVKEWVESFNAEKGVEKVVLTNAYMTCDPIYAIAMTKIPISDRWAKVKGGGKELAGYNMAHPSAVGYYQLADELAAEIAGRLGTLNTTNTSIGYAEDGYYGNKDEEVVNGKGLPFDNYVTTGEPADSQKVSGVLTNTMPTILYYSRTNRFIARHPSTLKYYEDFAAKSLYMTDGHPKADVIYWLGDVPYMYNGTTLVKMSEMGGGSSSAVDQTARDAAAAAQTTANEAKAEIAKHGLVVDVIDSGSSAPVDSGSTTSTTGQMYYVSFNQTFYLKVGNNFYSLFPNYPHASLYTNDSDAIFYCGNVPYQFRWSDGELVPLMGTGGVVSGISRSITNATIGSLMEVISRSSYEALTPTQQASKVYFIYED